MPRKFTAAKRDYCTAASCCPTRGLVSLGAFGLSLDVRVEVAISGRILPRRVERLCRRRPQPGQLPLGELARGGDAAFAQLRDVDGAVQILPRLTIADAAHRRQRRAERVALPQAAQFVDQSGIEHGLETQRDGRVQLRAVGRNQRDREGRTERPGRGFAPALQHRKRLPAQPVHFERALDALRVVGIEARGGRGIDRARARRAARANPRGAAPRVEFRAHAGVRAWQRRQPFGQRLEIKHRAAAENRHPAARANVRHACPRIARKRRRRIALGRVDDVDQVMRNARAVAGSRLCGSDVHAAIHLRRINGDDLAVKTRRQGKRDRALARRGGTHQQDGRDQG